MNTAPIQQQPSTKKTDAWDVNMPLLHFSESDVGTLKHTSSGILICGSIGDGKSSGLGKKTAKNLPHQEIEQ